MSQAPYLQIVVPIWVFCSLFKVHSYQVANLELSDYKPGNQLKFLLLLFFFLTSMRSSNATILRFSSVLLSPYNLIYCWTQFDSTTKLEFICLLKPQFMKFRFTTSTEAPLSQWKDSGVTDVMRP